ncbi:MAG: hypothetical protein KAY54_06325 [Burkholderiaceae bacterium]|nr:hypothetical protein [Burkholderiaceae bacterium]
MPFQAERFERAQFTARRQRVPVEALAAFFDEGEPAVWEVRGLSASELHRALEASRRQDSIESIVKAIAASGDQAATVRRALGLTKDTPGEIAKRLEMLVLGSVAPLIELPVAVRLAEAFPIEFLSLTNTISELTGKGFDLVKPAAASQPTTA